MASLLHLVTLLSVAAVTFTNARCSGSWRSDGKRCFLYVRKSQTFPDAEMYCMRKGGHLASYHAEKDVNFALNLMKKRVNTWTGAFDRVEENFFWYTDGSRFDYKNWNYRVSNHGLMFEPMGPMWEDCVEMLPNGRWNDIRCGRKFHAICAKPAD